MRMAGIKPSEALGPISKGSWAGDVSPPSHNVLETSVTKIFNGLPYASAPGLMTQMRKEVVNQNLWQRITAPRSVMDDLEPPHSAPLTPTGSSDTEFPAFVAAARVGQELLSQSLKTVDGVVDFHSRRLAAGILNLAGVLPQPGQLNLRTARAPDGSWRAEAIDSENTVLAAEQGRDFARLVKDISTDFAGSAIRFGNHLERQYARSEKLFSEGRPVEATQAWFHAGLDVTGLVGALAAPLYVAQRMGRTHNVATQARAQPSPSTTTAGEFIAEPKWGSSPYTHPYDPRISEDASQLAHTIKVQTADGTSSSLEVALRRLSEDSAAAPQLEQNVLRSLEAWRQEHPDNLDLALVHLLDEHPALENSPRIKTYYDALKQASHPVGSGTYMNVYPHPDGIHVIKVIKAEWVDDPNSMWFQKDPIPMDHALRQQMAEVMAQHVNALSRSIGANLIPPVEVTAPGVLKQRRVEGAPLAFYGEPHKYTLAYKTKERLLERAHSHLGTPAELTKALADWHVTVDSESRNFHFDPITGDVTSWFDPIAIRPHLK